MKDVKVTVSGAESGVGASVSWDGSFHGKITVTESEPDARIAYDLFFGDDPEPAKGEFVLKADGPRTEVTWTEQGDLGMNVFKRLMA